MKVQLQSSAAILSATRSLSQTTRAQQDVLQKLSTGFRINTADDDAAGYQISETLNSQIRGNKKALENIQDAYNMLSTIDGFLGQVGNILQRQNEIVVQANNGTNGPAQILALQQEFNNNADEIERMAESFQYNNLIVFRRDTPSNFRPYSFQVGANGSVNDLLDVSDILNLSGYNTGNNSGLTDYLNAIDGVRLTGEAIEGTYGRYSGGARVSVTTELNALSDEIADGATDRPIIIEQVQGSIKLLSSLRGQVGAHLNRFEMAANNLQIQIENQTSAMARFTNTDYAKDTAQLTRSQILQQSAVAVLSQSKSQGRVALSLLESGG
jgi:flagellin